MILPADRFVIGDLMSVSDKTEQTRRVQMEADGESMGRSRDRVAWGRHISHSERAVKVSGPRQTTHVSQGQADCGLGEMWYYRLADESPGGGDWGSQGDTGDKTVRKESYIETKPDERQRVTGQYTDTERTIKSSDPDRTDRGKEKQRTSEAQTAVGRQINI